MLPSIHRMHGVKLFKLTRINGIKCYGKHIIIFYTIRKNNTKNNPVAVGIIVRKIYNAILRNKWKRWLRACINAHLSFFDTYMENVIITIKSNTISTITYQEIYRDINYCINKLNKKMSL